MTARRARPVTGRPWPVAGWAAVALTDVVLAVVGVARWPWWVTVSFLVMLVVAGGFLGRAIGTHLLLRWRHQRTTQQGAAE